VEDRGCMLEKIFTQMQPAEPLIHMLSGIKFPGHRTAGGGGAMLGPSWIQTLYLLYLSVAGIELYRPDRQQLE
jgi:hypothetical protein